MALENIFAFVKDGGKVDVQDTEESSHADIKQLSERFQRVRELEGSVEQLKLLQSSDTTGRDQTEGEGTTDRSGEKRG